MLPGRAWLDHLESVLRPAIEAWAGRRSKVEACGETGAAGISAGPCDTDEEVVVDPHLAARHMLVELPRTDGVEQHVLVPGNPVKLSGVAEGPESRVPWLGEHTVAVLADQLGLTAAEIDGLRADGVVGCVGWHDPKRAH